MNHEHEQSHANPTATEAVRDHDVMVEPGQSSRSALLRKPEQPIASGLVQRKARDANGVADGAEHAISAASSSSGSSLPDTLMRKFESSLGADLSGVRIHTGIASEQAADAVGAKAYTMGNDIHFGAGHYDPSGSGGQHLLAHEVVHTVQQSGGVHRMQCKLEVSSPGDSLEHEADRAADAMVLGGAAAFFTASELSHRVLQRKSDSRSKRGALGNPGVCAGTESRNGIVYARYLAKKGTLVSESFLQLGYDALYPQSQGYGAYAGLTMGVDWKPLSDPDRIYPGQEYLIPVGLAVNLEAEEGEEITGYRTPNTQPAKEPWTTDWTDRFKHQLVQPGKLGNTTNLPYNSFELRGPEPPTRVPREAVAYWLTTHQQEIRNSAAKFNVDEYAIAGIIAWEALENPQAWSISSVGPGKMHLEAKSGQLSWPEAVEGTGRMPPLSKLLRKINLKKPAVAIDYIGASLDVASAIAELHGWSIRNNAGVLGQAYHSFTPEQWDTKVAAKAPDEPFELVPVTMGEWIPNNMPYLKKALGGP